MYREPVPTTPLLFPGPPGLGEHVGDCRCISPADFARIQQLSDRPFDLDACCSDDGSNALCKVFCSPRNSFLQLTDLSTKHVWINAPFSKIGAFISHYLALKAKSPATTSACILVPRWPGSDWSNLLQGMRKLTAFPMGYPLFKLNQESKPTPGIPWPVDIYYDPTYESVAVHRIHSADNETQMVMNFSGTISGAPGILAMDSQASHCFIDKAFVDKCGILTRPIHKMVELANGTSALLSAECTVYIRMPSKHSGSAYVNKLTCLVVDLGADHDIILGQDWLLKTGAELSFAKRVCTLVHSGLVLTPIPKQQIKTLKTPLLSVTQVKRALSKGARCFTVHVVATDTSVPPTTFASKLPEHISPAVRTALEKYESVFATPQGLPPDRGIHHVIPEIPGAKPHYRPPYRLSPLEVAEVEKQIKDLLLKGFIEPSNSPYGSPILFVGKKDGSLRLCCDFRKENAQTQKARFPLPRIDQLLDQLKGAQVFSSLDLQAGFHQILISPEDVPKTAFTTPFGHYHWRVMPFGCANAPSTFQSVMNKIFQPLLGKGVLVYMDDILVYAKTPAEHVCLLEKVLQILHENEFYAKLSKCEFELKELKYLGHIVGSEGIKVNPSKVSAVQDWPIPTSAKDVRSFLGLSNYFRKFIQGYATLVAPLTHLTRKNVLWTPHTWNDACQTAFDGIKQALVQAPVLALPDFGQPFTMEVICDASTAGIGAVLTQDGKALAYESKKLTDAEKKWTTTEQELWAVVHALHVWRCYLEGLPFTVVTDHNPNIYFQTQPNLSRRQARWSEYLQRFDFKWEYRPGRTNVADPLSRNTAVVLNSIMLKGVTTRLQTRSASAAAPQAPTGPRSRKRRASAAVGVPATQADPLVWDATAREPVDSPEKDVTIGASAASPVPLLKAVGAPVASDGDVVRLMQQGYANDPWFVHTTNTSLLSFKDGLWWRGQQVVVPDVHGLRQEILHELHDAPYSGHPGVSKTLRSVQRMYWWPALRADITKYVHTCVSCQRNKASTQKPAGKLQPLPIPAAPWSSVGMDFITHLPKTATGFTAIVVFIDRLTKMVHLAPTFDTVTAEGTADLFFNNVWKHHGLPDDLVTDRGSVFTGSYFTEVLRLVGTKHNRTTAYHPQSDGQTERVNRVLEDMLRHYVGSLRHGDWDKCLPAAEFAINNSFHESIGTTPFRLNYGRDPRLPLSIPTSPIPAAARFADQMEEGLTQAKRCLQAAQQRQKVYYDSRRRDVSFQEGEEVLLSTKHINLRRTGDKGSTPKLLPKWIGPFRITTVIGKGAYKLDLPSNMKIHNVFNVALLKAYRTDGRVQPPDPLICEEDNEEYFLIERLLDHRIRKRGRTQYREYLVKWQNYGSEHNSWEPESSLSESTQFTNYWNYVGLEPPPT